MWVLTSPATVLIENLYTMTCFTSAAYATLRLWQEYHNVHAGVIETVLALFVQYCGVNLLTGVSLTSKAPLSLPEAPHGPRAGANSALGCVQFSVVRISKGPRVLATTPNVIFPNTDQGTSPKRLNSKWKKIQNINRGGNAVPTLKKDL